MATRPTNSQSINTNAEGWCIVRATYRVSASLEGGNTEYAIEANVVNYCLDKNHNDRYSTIQIPVGGGFDGDPMPGVYNMELDNFKTGEEAVFIANEAAGSVDYNIWRTAGSDIKGFTTSYHEGFYDHFWFQGPCECAPTVSETFVTFNSTQPANVNMFGELTIPSTRGFIMTAAVDAIEERGLPGCCS